LVVRRPDLADGLAGITLIVAAGLAANALRGRTRREDAAATTY